MAFPYATAKRVTRRVKERLFSSQNNVVPHIYAQRVRGPAPRRAEGVVARRKAAAAVIRDGETQAEAEALPLQVSLCGRCRCNAASSQARSDPVPLGRQGARGRTLAAILMGLPEAEGASTGAVERGLIAIASVSHNPEQPSRIEARLTRLTFLNYIGHQK
ncbi:hypothetical protein NDU88_009638 [Pleurodeles waltl]|uniref:Uncharacterized protein n=1 Tax=Pleurodeles waltl TaxID=8319 RepID=A0AAV7PZZ0_PLEWA|nr:hypothetical protein NDU88_009638 [Pleurodeles waltl]